MRYYLSSYHFVLFCVSIAIHCLSMIRLWAWVCGVEYFAHPVELGAWKFERPYFTQYGLLCYSMFVSVVLFTWYWSMCSLGRLRYPSQTHLYMSTCPQPYISNLLIPGQGDVIYKWFSICRGSKAAWDGKPGIMHILFSNAYVLLPLGTRDFVRKACTVVVV